ncbi:MAG: single-stranded-DNA-specific exonuclease RecJ [Thermomicrobiales bacterium]
MALAVPSTTAIWHEPPTLSPDDLAITDWPLLSAILHRRGIRTPADVKRFLYPGELPFGDPMLLPDMHQAVSMIRDALESGETIGVFGDYDVDGISSTAMLTRALRRMGGSVVPRIPHRVNDGYGLNSKAVRAFASDGCRLLITVDCGSSNVAEIDLALSLGMKVIVVDHHRVHHELPREIAFISPKRDVNAYPEAELATAGVAYMLVRALLGDDEAEMYLPYAALATVADVVPLRGENRTIVARGLGLLQRWSLPGYKTLCKIAGIDRREIDAFDIGFVIGPRINAAGRMDSPDLALEWFLADDVESSTPYSQQLDRLNRERQADTKRVTQEAELQIRMHDDGGGQPALVVDGRDWSPGVIGIVAGRLAERFNRPAIVISRGPQFSTGSARTAGEVDIVEAIRACRDLLERFGGHTAAAGLTIETAKIDRFRQALSNAVLDQLDGELPVRELHLDAEVPHEDLSLATVEKLDVLEPCGHGNDRPLFLVRGLRPDRIRTSRDGKHLLFNVTDRYGKQHQATFFSAGERCGELMACGMIDAAADLRRNTWNGRVSLQLRLTDFRPASG